MSEQQEELKKQLLQTLRDQKKKAEAEKNLDKITRPEVIKYLENKYIFYCDREDKTLTLYIWQNHKWQDNAEAILLNDLSKFSEYNKPISKDELIDYFRGRGQDTEIQELPTNYIPFENGLYNLDTKQLEPLNPKYFFINQIPWKYKNIESIKWKFFQEDVHHKDDLQFIQEWWGYQLYRAYPIKGFLIALGSGNNGKSIEFNIIIKILGYKNITTASLQDLTYNLFTRAECYQKLANICDDLPNNRISSTGILKNLCAGGRINAQRKQGHPFDFTNYAKPSYSANDPPEIDDDTDSLWNRLKVVKYPNQFSLKPNVAKGEIQGIDQEKIEKILSEEIPGIINWMIEGLCRLRDNGFKFSYNTSTEETREYYRRKSNPCISWMEEMLKQTGNDDSDIVKKKDIPDHFRKWCEINGIKTKPSSNILFRTLKDEGIEPTQLKEFDRERCYIGYVMKKNINSNTATQDIDNFKLYKKSLLLEYIEKEEKVVV